MIQPDKISKSNRKTIGLTITRDGKVLLKAPTRASNKVIEKFLLEKQGWLEEKLSIINRNNASNADIISYNKLLLYAVKYTPVLTDNKKIIISENKMLVPKRIAPEKRLDAIKKWFKQTAKQIVTNRLEFLMKELKLYSPCIKVTDSKGRWGSCNSKGTICINWRVLMLEPKLIEYVLVHELVHLVELNHSSEFWRIVGSILPNYMQCRTEMKKQSFLLDLF